MLGYIAAAKKAVMKEFQWAKKKVALMVALMVDLLDSLGVDKMAVMKEKQLDKYRGFGKGFYLVS